MCRGNAGAPSGDLMWKSGTRAESSVQALCAVCKFAVCSVQCAVKSTESTLEHVEPAIGQLISNMISIKNRLQNAPQQIWYKYSSCEFVDKVENCAAVCLAAHKNSLRATGSLRVEEFHIIGVFEFSQLQIF